MTHAKITERPHYWREHVLAAAAYDGSIGQYAAAKQFKNQRPLSVENLTDQAWASSTTERRAHV